MKCYSKNTKFGLISVVQKDDYIIKIVFEKIIQGEFVETSLIKKTFIQLEEYFNGKRKTFNIPYKLNGTEFQKKVWQELIKIEYGETSTYKEIGQKIGYNKGFRAIGNACNKNPILIIIPCHRIISSLGSLTGYAGGINIKEKLLNLEKNKF